MPRRRGARKRKSTLTFLLEIFGKGDQRRGSRICDEPLQLSWKFLVNGIIEEALENND